jgi:hypothetical protein
MVELEQLLIPIIAAIAGAISSYVVAVGKTRMDLASQYDINLQNKRFEAYSELWKLMELLAKWSPPKATLSYKDLKEISCNFRHWYFSKGGLYISEPSMLDYGRFQDEIIKLTRDKDENEILPDPERESIRKLSSELRHALTVDIASRRKPMTPADSR